MTVGRRPDAGALRRSFRAELSSGRLLRFLGAFSPLVARLIEDAGFEGIYVSGAALSADLALPDIGLTTLTEVADRTRAVVRAVDLPVLVDVDTGFGEPLNVARTVEIIEATGAAGCQIEDQVNPKRCGHLDNKTVVAEELMVQRIRAAATARTDPNFVICARTDARALEGLGAAISRAQRYLEAGADMVFPEALLRPEEFAAFRTAIDAPLLANMTEFGKSPLLGTGQLEELGFNLVIYPVTTLRVAMGAVEAALAELAEHGDQVSFVDRMQSRSRLYEVLGYQRYTKFDADIFNFDISEEGAG
jgi:methylisocitrate lyase